MDQQIVILENQQKKLRELIGVTPENDVSLDGLRNTDWKLEKAIGDMREFTAAKKKRQVESCLTIDLTGSSSETEDEGNGGGRATAFEPESDVAIGKSKTTHAPVTLEEP